MTLQEFYERHVLPVMAMSQDTADSIEEEQYTGVINAVLTDCSDINNAMRLKKGEEEIAVAWYAADDDLPYEYELLANCICYGAASRLYVDEAGDEANMVQFLEANYEKGKQKYISAEYVDALNIWSVLEV